jgi:hypothetical protein
LGDCADNDYGPGDYPAGFYPEGATAEYDDELGFGERDAMVWAGAPPPIRDLRTAPRRPRRRRAPIFHAKIETIVHDSKFPQHINVARDVAYQTITSASSSSTASRSSSKAGITSTTPKQVHDHRARGPSRNWSGPIIERTRADGSTGSRRRVRRHLSREQPRCGRWHCCGPSIGCR